MKTILTLCTLVLAACGSGDLALVAVAPCRPTVVLIGDSITASMPAAQLPSMHVVNAGVPGNTSAQVAARFKRDALDRKPDGVVLMAGTNDVSISDRPDFAAMTSMVGQAIAAGTTIAVATIPPIANFDAVGGALAVMARGSMWNTKVKALGVPVADVHTVLAGVEGAMGPDNVHPTAKGYGLAAGEIDRAVREHVKCSGARP